MVSIFTSKFLVFFAIMTSCLVVFSVVAQAQFNPLESSCDEVVRGQTSAVCEEARNTTDPVGGTDGIITRVANIIALVGAIAAVIVIIIAGITMMLSGGDSAKIQSSRNAIIYASIGIVVIVVSRSLVIFIINQISN